MAKEKYTEHPSITVIGGKPHLRVLEDFFIEEELPKWKKIAVKLKEEKTDCTADSFSPRGNGSIQDGRQDAELIRNAKFDRRHYVEGQVDRRSISNAVNGGKKKSFFARVFDNIKDRFDKGTAVEDTFKGVKDAVAYPTNESLLFAAKMVDVLIERSKVAGQYEIADRVSGIRKVLEAEIVLAKNNMLRYITEEQVVRFMLQSEKGVRMEYLRYYNDILPSKVVATKMSADALLAFDNYCILYYDNDTKKFSLIKESIDDRERQKRRDPILFGLIKGSRKLYYVTDWITEDDDLTLEKFQKVIGEEALNVGEEPIADTQYTAVRLFNSITIDTSADVERAAEAGLLITDDNFDHFLKTGEVAYSMRNAKLPEVVPGTAKDGNPDNGEPAEPDGTSEQKQ